MREMDNPMNRKMEEHLMRLPDEAKRAESMNESFDSMANLSGKSTEFKSAEEIELEQLNKLANFMITKEWAGTLGQKQKALMENKKEIQSLTNITNVLFQDIKKIKKEIVEGGITPIKKAQLKETLANLEKGYEETKRLANLEIAKTHMIENTEYPEPKNIYKDVKIQDN